MEVCDVKSRLIRVAALDSAGKEDEAQQIYLETCHKTPGSSVFMLILVLVLLLLWNLKTVVLTSISHQRYVFTEMAGT